MDLQLRDSTFVVTGGSSGLGLATARSLAAEGATVIIVGRDADRAAAAAADYVVAPPLADGGGGRPSGLILVLSVAALALTAINMFGGFAVTRRMLAMFRK